MASCASVPKPKQSVKETEDGFYITATYSEYQFFPNTSSVYDECNARIQSLADYEAYTRNKKVQPIKSSFKNTQVERNEFTGITTCTITVKALWDATYSNNIINNKKNEGAFGTSYGMTKKDIHNLGINFISGNRGENTYFSDKAPKTNKNFTLYAYSFDKQDKLCKVTGLRRLYSTDTDNVKLEINKTKNLLVNIYGDPKHINKISNQKNWLKDNAGGSKYSFIWAGQNISEQGIVGIFLFPFESKNLNPTIYLSYIFMLDCNNSDESGL